jgi:hypothetical protein
LFFCFFVFLFFCFFVFFFILFYFVLFCFYLYFFLFFFFVFLFFLQEIHNFFPRCIFYQKKQRMSFSKDTYNILYYFLGIFFFTSVFAINTAMTVVFWSVLSLAHQLWFLYFSVGFFLLIHLALYNTLVFCDEYNKTNPQHPISFLTIMDKMEDGILENFLVSQLWVFFLIYFLILMLIALCCFLFEFTILLLKFLYKITVSLLKFLYKLIFITMYKITIITMKFLYKMTVIVFRLLY